MLVSEPLSLTSTEAFQNVREVKLSAQVPWREVQTQEKQRLSRFVSELLSFSLPKSPYAQDFWAKKISREGFRPPSILGDYDFCEALNARNSSNWAKSSADALLGAGVAFGASPNA